ncbi:MAG: cytochrome bc complex cytochrome b subunit [Armatimonadota bacterium]|nr:cytochrome bc complex cytochrome b subunit [Armatimonadota bacterium]MDR7426470.1 cytochrome bc complex cytochrome b subunit [Armatimonadota bacterium]MDR7463367.1 cytochrome bc complex cytochrome b subunit [Armatimonadota bacterium]MDR7468578.1 cytochrome bc complex cytochrome b subunit [Armatimonadota bacterium]MDR7475171.1 cytochrome bc complex cytochrome b subunit [Armatimonadota bacterium]
MGVRDWLNERLRYEAAQAFLEKKAVPVHRYAVTYYTGGVTLFFFVVQVLTGLLLLMYYRPASDAAFESVRLIIAKVRFGWLVRNIHVWSANAMVGAAVLHLAATFFSRAYRKPRELTWVSGVLLLGVTLAFAFTGYLLPWNTLAYFATKVGTEIAGDVPVIGRALMVLLRGGEDITAATLIRFFGIHVAILPALATVLLGLHLTLVQIHGMSRPISVRVRGEERFYPEFMLRDFIVWVVLLGGLAVVATLWPWPLGEKADPLAPAPAGLRPEWYFLFMYQTLRMIPGRIAGLEGEAVGVTLFALTGLALLLVPFLDCWAQREHKHPLFPALGAAAFAFVLLMTALALVAGM